MSNTCPPGRTALERRVGDHGSFLAAMLERLPDHPALRALTVRTPDDPAVALLDVAAVLGDLLTFHTERTADEGYLRTADEHRSVALLGRLVGYRPRPGLSASTHLAYTVDPRSAPDGEEPDVLIPRGARSRSVPATSGEEPQTFETDLDLIARAAWNELAVRRRRPTLLVPDDLERRPEILVAGTTTGVQAGDRLLFLFGGSSDVAFEPRLLQVTRVRVDPAEDVTAIGLPQSPPATLGELVAELRQWITAQPGGEPVPNPRPSSRLIDEFDAQVLAPLRAELNELTTPERFASALAVPHDRLAEASVLAASDEPVADWFEELAAVIADLAQRALALGGRPGDAELPATSRKLRPPVNRRVAPQPAPGPLRALLAMSVTAAPFGATAPLQPVQDEHGRVIRLADRPLPGVALTTVRVAFDTGATKPVRAEFVHAESQGTAQHSENLPADTTFDLAPGTVTLKFDGRGPVSVDLKPGLPEFTLTVGIPGKDQRVHVTIGGEAFDLAPGEHRELTQSAYELTVRHTDRSEPPAIEINIATVPDAAHRTILALDSVYDGIKLGSWVAIERPRKGTEIPGDAALKLVTTQVTAVRTAVPTAYGIAGRCTELTLADPWLDAHDVLLSQIRDATVHAAGVALRPADEPLGQDVHGNELELAEHYDGLAPGRALIVTGERTDVPGVQGTEAAVIAVVRHGSDPNVPGDYPHTTLTLATGLTYRYRRDTVRVLGNVVPASHGESRDEAIGNGDATAAHQTFTLWQAPLAWLPTADPSGAVPTLEIRADGLLWHRADAFTGRGPTERIYVLDTAVDGRSTVTFGDGVNGARLPTGHENVRARYRFGTGAAGDVAANRITQAVTRPLGVTAVTNPIPATGGADGDGPGLARRRIPLAATALDRLTSTADYADFARSRAGIGRAAARQVFDGRRQVVHVTVAGVDDAPIAPNSGPLPALRAAFAAYGDPCLPVRIDVRERAALWLAARVRLLPDHSWEVVEPWVRQALLRRLGYRGRELGQSAYLSEALATAQSVPGVDYVDVEVFGTAAGESRPVVPARLAEYDEDVHEVGDGGETLTEIARAYGIGLAELLRLNPDITDTRPLERGRTVVTFRGVRPARFVLLTPETLTLTEIK